MKKNKDIACVIIEPIAGNMGLVPAKQDFLEELAKICKNNQTLLIFDEVMSGYRASYLGSYGINHIQADIITFGKVIGGGLPAAAFASRAEIMDILSPLGGVYQAGTLSGNPLAMAAGIASLTKAKKKTKLYDKLGKLAKKLTQGMKKLADEKGLPLQACHVGSMFGYFFTKDPVSNYQDALKSDLALFSKFHKNMLENGIYLAPSQFETGFICSKMDDKIIDTTLEAVRESFKRI